MDKIWKFIKQLFFLVFDIWKKINSFHNICVIRKNSGKYMHISHAAFKMSINHDVVAVVFWVSLHKKVETVLQK